MKLFLIRHAESENNAKPLHARVADPGLTPRGRLQANALADYLSDPGCPFAIKGKLITSPFRRTLQTTLTVRQRLPGPISIDSDVFENGGCFTGHQPANYAGAPGMNRSSIKSLVDQAGCDAEICPTIGDAGWWNQPHRESDEAAAKRASVVSQRWVQRWGESPNRITAILHADFIRTLLRQMLNDDASVNQLPPIKNTSITEIDYREGDFLLVNFNRTPHAPDRLVQIGVGGTGN